MPTLRSRPWFARAHRCWLIALLAGIVCGSSFLLAKAGGDEAPVEIQRIFLEPNQAAKEFEKVQQGALVALPKQEFEDRLERVRRIVQGRAQKPRLTRAHYRAELVERSFTNGSGQWMIQYAGAAPALLPIDPFNLALSKLKWDEGGDAVLAEFDGKSLGLLVKQAGSPTLLFDWSARGTSSNDGIVFNLAVPFCPMSTFEFKLAAEDWLMVPKGAAVVTGPHETETPAKRLWTMQLIGAKPIEITVRKVAQPKGPAPIIFARVLSKQQLAPDRLAVEHDFQLDVQNGSVRELILEGDSSLQPYNVLLANGEVSNWQWQEIAAKKDANGKLTPASGLLTVQFPQPVQGRIKSLRVQSLAVQTAAGLWASPALRVRDALSRGETLEVRLHPDFAVGRWDPGSFQPTNLTTDPDGAQVLTLAETAETNAASRRPMLVLPVKGIDLHTTEKNRWQIDPRGTTLDAEIRYALGRGHLSELRIKLPAPVPRYQLETLDMQPAELLRGWRLDGNILVVELKQPLTPARKATLKITLRASIRAITAGTRILAYPDLEPLDGTKREGTLYVHVDGIFQPQLMGSSIPPAPLDEAERANNAAMPTYHFAFRDQRPSASIRLMPQPVQATLHGKHLLSLSEQHALLRFRWEVQPLVGEPEFLDFRCPPGFPSWKVKPEDNDVRIHYWERLYLQEALPHLLQIGAPHGLHAMAGEAMLPIGTQWRFHLAEPLRKKAGFTLEATSPAGLVDDEWRKVSARMPTAQPWESLGGALATEVLPKSGGAKVWSLPLMTPMQRTNVSEEITVASPSESISKFVDDGAFEVSATAFKADKTPTKLQLHLNAGASVQAAKITLWTNPAKLSTSQLELCDEARLSTYVYRDGRVYHRIQFRLWNWHERTAELRLPADLHVCAVKVQDRWIAQPEIDSSSAVSRLTVPFDQNAEFVRYEILARSEPPTGVWPGLRSITVPRIHWPIAPLDMRTRLFLEDGLTPWDRTLLSAVGVPQRIAGQSETLRWIRRVWNGGQAWWPIGAETESRAKMEAQRQSVLLAEAKLRGTLGKAMTLAQVIERYTLEHLQDAAPLVIDRIALRSLGLTADTILSQEALSPHAGRPFWEKLKLVYVACPSGALLTSRQRLQSLGIDPDEPLETAVLDEATQEAILHGRDASAGFYLALAWLRLPPEEPTAFTTDPTSVSSRQAGEFPEMIEWEWGAAGIPPGGIRIIDPVNARIIGWLIALLTALVLWKMQRTVQPVVGVRIYLLLLAISLLIVIGSPAHIREVLILPSFLVEILGALCCVILFIRRRGQRAASGPSTVSHPATTAALLGFLALSLTWSVTAQAPAPRVYPVYMIGGTKPAVLVTPDLIAKLDELEKQPALGPHGAVLVSAKYTGTIKDNQAKVEVLYEIHSVKDKANLVIPLTGVQLGEGVFLDGAPVFLGPHKNGYALSIRGKGPHHLRLSFSTMVRASPKSDRLALQFNVPKLVQNEITLQWQTPVHAVHCENSCGDEKTTPDPRQAVKEWRAQLGYEKDVHLRWSGTAAQPFLKEIEVKEAHFWDLRPGSLTLWSTFHYAISKGSLGQLSISMPEGLHVRSVEALPGPIVVKHWNVVGKGGERRLSVDLAQPVTGNLTLNLEIVPQAFAHKSKLLLPLPASRQGKSMTGLLGYRLDAAEINRVFQNLVAVQSIPMEEFEQQWKKRNGPPLPSGSRARTFQRGNAQQAGLELWIDPSPRQSAATLRWDVDQHYADLQGKFTITSPQQDLVFVEFFIDKSLTLADVAGPDVRRWSLQDSLLQVWLRQPRKETTLELTGWRKATPGTEKTWALPCIYALQTQFSAATIEVRPAARIQLKAENLRGMRADLVDRNRFHVDKTPYAALFRISTDTALPAAAMLTKVHATEQSMEVWVGIRLTTQRGQLPGLKVHLKDWPHELMHLDAQGAIVQQMQGKGLKHPTWTLKYSPGLPQEVFVTLRGRVAKDKLSSVLLPVVEVEGAVVHRQWLAWRDVEIVTAGTGKKVSHQKSARDRLAPFAADGWLKDLALWSNAEATPFLRAVLPKTAPRTTVRVLASGETARFTEGREWLHEATFWVRASERSELRFKFPAPVKALSVWADHRLQAALPAAPLDFVLTLDAGSAPHLVELRWKYAARDPEPEAPTIAALQIDQVPLPAHERIVWIPPGLFNANADPRPSPTYLERLLDEAQGHMEMAAALGQESPRDTESTKRIGARQENFYSCVRQAEHAVSILKHADPVFDPTSPLKRLSDLRTNNTLLAKEGRYDEQRKVAKKAKKVSAPSATTAGFGAAGIPLLLKPNLSTLKLQSVAVQTSSQQRTTSELVLLGAIFLLVLSYFRHGWPLLSAAAPEITIGLVASALALFGMSLIGVFLIAVMVIIRAFWISAKIKKRLKSGARLDAEGMPSPPLAPPGAN